VVAALDTLRRKHANRLSGDERRHLLAGIDLELAATRYRNADMVGMIAPLLRSVLRSPLRNGALAAVLHNRSNRN
jgi:hypothetical protein